MDASSLFLTANADTVYSMSVVDLSNGPMVIEQPSNGLRTINDMWFSWVIDIGFPGPDRGLGGNYLIVPPGYDGPLPEGGYFIAHAKTDRVLQGEDASFCAICEDYAEALRALEHWQRAGASAQRRIEEYRRLSPSSRMRRWRH